MATAVGQLTGQRRRRRARTRSLAVVRAELVALEQERAQLVTAIAATVGPGVVFSIADLFQHATVTRELQAVFSELNIRSARQLGKRLRHLGLAQLGHERGAVLWRCE